ncbi:peptide chain release factor 3 [Agrilactobacillus composti DSM 18527 = JCM 14202]|nr:peptide chain release factor 3 [Agrilactobacillus composti DSM 18527 = JCM 14202]
MNWPIGMGKGLKGLYDRAQHRIELYRPSDASKRFLPLNDQGQLAVDSDLTQDSIYQQTLDDVDLLSEAGNSFDLAKVQKGDQTPVFFGSALTNFGVETFLESFLKMAPAPGEHPINDDSAELAPNDDALRVLSSKFKLT